jgi:membrane protease YdiL (CAAX protease family)
MYIEQGYKGKHEIWMYLVGVLVVFIGWQFLGGIPLLAAVFATIKDFSSFPRTVGEMSELLGSNPFLIVMLVAFVFGIVTLFLYVKYLHKLHFRPFTTARKKIDWKRIWFAFSFWAVISGGIILIDVNLAPADYVFNFDLKKFIPLFLIVVLLIPIQTSFEEYFMRGYLMQGLGILAKNKWVPLIITSSIFGLLHIFNPEVQKLGYGIMVFYIGTGFFLGICTLMDEGLELALGFHAANNMIAALLVTAEWTAFTTDSVYRDVSDPVLGWDVLVPVFVVFPIILLIFARKYGWSNWKERLFGKVLTKEEFAALETNTDDLA